MNAYLYDWPIASRSVITIADNKGYYICAKDINNAEKKPKKFAKKKMRKCNGSTLTVLTGPYLWNAIQKLLGYNILLTLKEHYVQLQLNLNSSNTDGSFTMVNSNSVLSPYEIIPLAEENKY